MAYVTRNPKSKAEIKKALKEGKSFYVFFPGMGELPKGGGTVYLEGPHYPQPHKWYGVGTVDADGKLLTIK